MKLSPGEEEYALHCRAQRLTQLTFGEPFHPVHLQVSMPTNIRFCWANN
ncbi:MAG: hypothetical protein ACYDC6_12440 [Acidobacteriaceae bacterium]